MTSTSFVYRDNFPELTNLQIDGAIAMVSAQWYGSLTLWGAMPLDVATAKRTALLNLLTAWFLANKYPGDVRDAIAGGALPVSSKSIGGTSLSYLGFDSVQDALKPLLSNQWGIDALTMILASGERFAIYG